MEKLEKAIQEQELRKSGDESYYGARRFAGLLMVIAFISEWIAVVILAQATSVLPEGAEGYTAFAAKSKPYLYYPFHGVGFIALFASGFIAAINGGHRKVTFTGWVAFWGLQLTSLTWAIIALFTDETYGLWELFSGTGPFVWLVCLAVFAGTDEIVWKRVAPIIELLAYASALLVLIAMLSIGSYARVPGLPRPLIYLVVLWWLGGWIFLSPFGRSSWLGILRSLPYATMLITSIFVQARTWVANTILLLLIRVFWSSRIHENPKWYKRQTIIMVFLGSVFLLSLFAMRGEIATDTYKGFLTRLADDTRWGQYEEFFKQVSFMDLVVGKGPKATWDWSQGGKKYKYIDNSIIWMAFKEGILLPMFYVILLILPGIVALFKGARGLNAVAALLLCMWGLMLVGFCTYTLPSISLSSYIICMMAGRCYQYLSKTSQFNTRYTRPKAERHISF